MGRVKLEMDTVELQYALNSISAAIRFMDKAAKKDTIYYLRKASLEALKDSIKKTLKEQAEIEDLREGIKVIEGNET